MGFWSSVSSAAGAVGGAIKDGAEAVGDAANQISDAAEDIGDAGGWFADHACSIDGDVTCGLGSGLGGLWSGAFSASGGILSGGGQFAGGLLSGVGNLLQGRFKDAAKDGIAALGGAFVVGTEVLSIPGRVVDETVRHWQRNQLRHFVEDLIDRNFKGEQRSEVRKVAGVEKTHWGMNVEANHRNLAFDSREIKLSELHPQVFDLYKLAGLEESGIMETYPTPVVNRMRGQDQNSSDLATEDDIDSYLKTGSPPIRILSAREANTEAAMRYAKRIATDVGIRLQWRSEICKVLKDDVTANSSPIIWRPHTETAAFMKKRKFRDGLIGSECTFEALSVLFPFLSNNNHRGYTSGIDLHESGGGCALTPDRDDSCCANIMSGSSRGSSVAYLWPRDAGARISNRFILAHEMGHWLGLCHRGHDKYTEIMLTLENTNPFSALLTPTILFRGAQHPRFTGKDGRNIWRFIINQRAGKCFAVQAEPSPVE